jgi:hypothetical protein
MALGRSNGQAKKKVAPCGCCGAERAAESVRVPPSVMTAPQASETRTSLGRLPEISLQAYGSDISLTGCSVAESQSSGDVTGACYADPPSVGAFGAR